MSDTYVTDNRQEVKMAIYSKTGLVMGLLGLTININTPVMAQMPTQLSNNQLEKRSKKLSKLTAQHFVDTATIKDGELETSATITTQQGFHWRGDFASRVRPDNFLRAFVDKQTGEALWQLYQTMEYTGEWRRFTSVNIKLPSGLIWRDISVLERKVETCAFGTCVYRETVGFDLTEEELEALVAAADEPTQSRLPFKFSSQNGFDWTDDISVAEISGALQAVERYRNKNGLN